MNTKETRMALAIAALVLNFIRTATQEDLINAAIVTVVFAIVMAILYWYNNSHTTGAKIGDYVKDTIATLIEEGDLTKIDQIQDILEGGDDDDEEE